MNLIHGNHLHLQHSQVSSAMTGLATASGDGAGGDGEDGGGGGGGEGAVAVSLIDALQRWADALEAQGPHSIIGDGII